MAGRSSAGGALLAIGGMNMGWTAFQYQPQRGLRDAEKSKNALCTMWLNNYTNYIFQQQCPPPAAPTNPPWLPPAHPPPNPGSTHVQK